MPMTDRSQSSLLEHQVKLILWHLMRWGGDVDHASTIDHDVNLLETLQTSIEDVAPRGLDGHVIGMRHTRPLWCSLCGLFDVALMYIHSEHFCSFCCKFLHDAPAEAGSCSRNNYYLVWVSVLSFTLMQIYIPCRLIDSFCSIQDWLLDVKTEYICSDKLLDDAFDEIFGSSPHLNHTRGV